MLTVKHLDLKKWVSEILKAAGLCSDDASLVSDSLVQTSLWGIDSHGISRLPHYLKRIELKSINATPNFKYKKNGAAVGTVDGDNGLGIMVSHYAMVRAIQLAKEAGAGVIGIEHSSHCGALGLYSRQAARDGCIGIAFTHSDSFVKPYSGTEAFFGTNPISIAIPSEDADRPLCVDMATSIIPWNIIMNARRDKSLVPENWGVDSDGNKTIYPEKIRAVNPMGEHKGYALGFLIDMLSGPLNGMPFGPHIPPMYQSLGDNRNLGSLVIAIEISRFSGAHMVSKMVSQAINEVKLQNEKICYPGEPEYLSQEHRLIHGIPIEDALFQELNECSLKLGVKPIK